MKKGLLGSTALIGATAMMAGVAGAAEAPTWKLTGNMNFQAYYISQDNDVFATNTTTPSALTFIVGGPTAAYIYPMNVQDHGWYFGVDESELQLNVSGTADNGLNYGFKIEINANTSDTKMADEARLQFSGGWGTLQMGDEDGVEDIMNYGGENLMGATGGFDGDQGDVLLRMNIPFLILGNAPSGPTIAGDTSDATKISYFSPRFSGLQVGASVTPTPNNGDNFKKDGAWENNIGLGANYDNSFGGMRVRASVVYDTASSTDPNYEDTSAWSVGGIVGFGPFSVGANYTDNGESGQPLGSGYKASYWDAAASFENGPMYLSAGYFSSKVDVGTGHDSTYDAISLTADYKVAPGLGVYAETDFITDESAASYFMPALVNHATEVIVGANVSF